MRTYEVLGKRKMTGSSIPVGSPLGKMLLSSEDKQAVVDAIRTLVQTGESTPIILTDQKLIAELNKEI